MNLNLKERVGLLLLLSICDQIQGRKVFRKGLVVLYQILLLTTSTFSMVIITILAMLQVLHYHHVLSSSNNHSNKENYIFTPNNYASQQHQHSLEGFKQKSELCKKFMEEGYCPFQDKCKFAHGSHELLWNNQQNMRYKTKLCQNFGKKHYCCYGNRCNFIHRHEVLPHRDVNHRSDLALQMIRKECHQESRILTLL